MLTGTRSNISLTLSQQPHLSSKQYVVSSLFNLRTQTDEISHLRKKITKTLNVEATLAAVSPLGSDLHMMVHLIYPCQIRIRPDESVRNCL